MKHGVNYKNPGPCGIDRLPEDFHCLGYPVEYDEDSPYVAHAVTFHVKHIVVGPAWFTVSGGEQWAVLLHEAGHLVSNHFWKRVLWIPLCWTKAAERMAQLQELEADDFVIRQGYGAELLRFFSRALHLPDDSFHPDMRVRYLYVEGQTKRGLNAA